MDKNELWLRGESIELSHTIKHAIQNCIDKYISFDIAYDVRCDVEHNNINMRSVCVSCVGVGIVKHIPFTRYLHLREKKKKKRRQHGKGQTRVSVFYFVFAHPPSLRAPSRTHNICLILSGCVSPFVLHQLSAKMRQCSPRCRRQRLLRRHREATK